MYHDECMSLTNKNKDSFDFTTATKTTTTCLNVCASSAKNSPTALSAARAVVASRARTTQVLVHARDHVNFPSCFQPIMTGSILIDSYKEYIYIYIQILHSGIIVTKRFSCTAAAIIYLSIY